MTTRSPAEQTAFGPTMFAALEQYVPPPQRVIDDRLAIRFLPPSLRMATRAMRWRFLRKLVLRSIDKQLPGICGGMLARKRYVEDQVTAAAAAGIDQLVVLGAGLDTTALRLARELRMQAYEVDLPDNNAYKQKVVRRVFGGVPDRVALIPMDLGTADLPAALARVLADRGFDNDKPAMYVWEGVTQYLTPDAVDATATALGRAAPGSRLIFTYILRDFLEGQSLFGWDKGYREFVVDKRLWTYGLAPRDVEPLLNRYGWKEQEQVGIAEYAERYFQPAGRDLTAMPIERFVSAVRP